MSHELVGTDVARQLKCHGVLAIVDAHAHLGRRLRGGKR